MQAPNHLLGEPIGILVAVVAADTEQDQDAGADLRHPLAVDLDRRPADPLHERPHPFPFCIDAKLHL